MKKGDKKLVCPNCRREIKTMRNLTKRGMKYYCKCGTDVSKPKLRQLIDFIRGE